MRIEGNLLDAPIWACLRAYPARPVVPVDPARPGFWERAAGHGAAVLLARQLDAGGDAPSARNVARAQGVRGLLSRVVLQEVLRIFGREGIPLVPLKGPIVARRLYGDPLLRPTGDVDVLVAERDLDRALTALERAGALLPGPASYRYHRRHHHHVNADFRGVVVEVHFRAKSGFGGIVPSEPLLARAREEEVGGARVAILDPTDELVFLAVNAAAHWFRGILLLDLRLLAEKERIDWAEVDRRAHAWGMGTATAAALVAAEARAGLDAGAVQGAWRRRGERALRLLPDRGSEEAVRDTRAKLRNLALQTVLADSGFRGGRVLLHHVGRKIRRVTQRTWPSVAPGDWAG